MSADTAYISWYETVVLNSSWTNTLLMGTGTTVGTDAGFSGYTTYYDNCDAGYICSEGATSRTPTSLATDGGYECPIGHYCPSGALIEIPCLPGTYNDAVRQATCTYCPAGKRCPEFGMTTPLDCDAGSYCPVELTSTSSTHALNEPLSIDGVPCPAGTYISTTTSTNTLTVDVSLLISAV